MPFTPEDHRLSMRMARRAKDEAKNEDRGLRTLLLHRLVSGWKVVWRRSLSGRGSGIYCERCDFWVHWAEPDEAPEAHQCRRCGTWFLPEMVVYREVSADLVDELFGDDKPEL